MLRVHGVPGAPDPRQEVSPLQAVNAYVERIERIDPQVHSYLHVAADHALEAARQTSYCFSIAARLEVEAPDRGRRPPLG